MKKKKVAVKKKKSSHVLLTSLKKKIYTGETYRALSELLIGIYKILNRGFTVEINGNSNDYWRDSDEYALNVRANEEGKLEVEFRSSSEDEEEDEDDIDPRYDVLSDADIFRFLGGELNMLDEASIDVTIRAGNHNYQVGFNLDMVPACCGAYVAADLVGTDRTVEAQVLNLLFSIYANRIPARDSREFLLLFTHKIKTKLYAQVKTNPQIEITGVWENDNTGNDLFMGQVKPIGKIKVKNKKQIV